jgi:DNA-binding transcriptional MerR regulator
LPNVTWYSREDAAERVGVEPSYLARLVDLGILVPEESDRFSPGDVRRVLLARSLEDAGISLEEVAAAIQHGALSIAFLDATSYERFAALASETFRQVSDRTGIPLELLMVIREAIGMAEPSPDDRLREDELAIVPFIELQVAEGFRPVAIERLLRVQGDGTRRITEQEAAWWTSEVIEPAIAAGKGPEEIGNAELADRTAQVSEQALLAMYHAQQAHAWTANIIEGFEVLMAKAGIRSRLERPPAICFLDITGYTRLTQERGDDAAADLSAPGGRRHLFGYGDHVRRHRSGGAQRRVRNGTPAAGPPRLTIDSLASSGRRLPLRRCSSCRSSRCSRCSVRAWRVVLLVLGPERGAPGIHGRAVRARSQVVPHERPKSFVAVA